MPDNKTCFILFDEKTKTVWGVFTSKHLLYSMYHNLQSICQGVNLFVKEYLLDTNIVVTQFNSPDSIRQSFNPYTDNAEKDASTSVPTELKSEFEKLQTRYSDFNNNFKLFKQFIADGVLTLDTNIKDVPHLLRNRFEVFSDIVRLNIPGEEAFGYFMDRYYYKTEKYTYLSDED